MTFTVTSDNFNDGDYLPNDFVLSADFGFGCAGGNKSPHLKWSGAPQETQNFAVTCYALPRTLIHKKLDKTAKNCGRYMSHMRTRNIGSR
jgi:hypothetical protein